jgi:hypothetical protein
VLEGLFYFCAKNIYMNWYKLSSKYDTLASKLAKVIFERVIASGNIIESNKEDMFSVRLHTSTIDFVNVFITERNSDIPLFMTAAYVSSKKVINVGIMLGKGVNISERTDLYEDFSFRLKSALRHEIEHSLQNKDFLKQNPYVKHKNQFDFLLGYLLHSAEMGPFIRSYYLEAKKRKITFSEMLEIVYRDRIKKLFDDKGLSEEEASKLWSIVKPKWIEFAVKYLPKVQV